MTIAEFLSARVGCRVPEPKPSRPWDWHLLHALASAYKDHPDWREEWA